MKRFKLVFFTIVGMIFVASCNRGELDVPNPVNPAACRIVLDSADNGLVYEYLYEDWDDEFNTYYYENMIIRDANSTTEYSIEQNMPVWEIFRTEFGYADEYLTSIGFDGTGLATHWIKKGLTGSAVYRTNFTYDGNQLIKSENYNHIMGVCEFSDYEWTNGNLTTERHSIYDHSIPPRGKIRYEYYDDIDHQMGDYWSREDRVKYGGFYDAKVYGSMENALKRIYSVIDNPENETDSLRLQSEITYDFNAQGLISSMTIDHYYSNADSIRATEKYYYSYECDN